ncbi:peptide ABC transporter substrate-binding protein [Scleromatobacter humisilvae]|uniref:Peptide ABC transporter substrate-binding protein n=1 Tax=Scleromatobacter humisilvae TaxID=2897159 RepID=A0A9X1YJM8_9BURK|nr:peptide ABC transporter substrate-binding protein [Scleromatobacter humisilvae]MCK9687729.1 peptide ABC transporter substrate-binding protein [Scleromatobacter humisilvae]
MSPRRQPPLARALLVLALGAIAVATATAATIPPGTQLAAKQEMVRNNGAEPESLDPAYIESVNGAEIERDLFEGLTSTNHHGDVVPGVAESWKQADATTWVFTLRKTAVWSNGQPVTADDFVYAWRRFLDPKTASKIASTYGIYLLNGLDVVGGKKPVTELGVRAIDKETLEVRTAGPVSFLPQVVSVAQYSPQPKATIEKFGRDWTKPGNIVGNGAFVLKDWSVNSKVVIEKNPKYWDAANVQLTRVTFLCVEDNNADLKLYQSGEEDFMQQLAPGAYTALKAQYPAEMHNGPMLGIRYYSLNNLDPLLKDIRVRKALSMVIDRDILASKVTADGQAPLYGLAVKGLAGISQTRYDWADWPMDKRVAEARKLLADAGVKPGTHVKFTYNNSDYHKKMAIFAASEWKTKLGLETDMDSLEFKVLIRKRHDGDYQIGRNGWIATFNDATIFLALVQCGSESNDDKNCNPKADELIVQGNQQTDPARREALLTQAAKLVMDDYPMIPLLQYTVPRLIKPWIGGYDDTNGTDRYRSKDFYIVKH